MGTWANMDMAAQPAPFAHAHICPRTGSSHVIRPHVPRRHPQALMLKRRIKGPGWMGIAAPQLVPQANQATWCKVGQQQQQQQL